MIPNPNKPFHLVLGDRYTAIGRTLYNGPSPADLTGLTVQFYMIAAAGGSPVVNWANAVVVAPSAGTVKYSFQANEPPAAGLYYGWFRAGNGSLWTTYPAHHQGIPIIAHSLAADENH